MKNISIILNRANFMEKLKYFLISFIIPISDLIPIIILSHLASLGENEAIGLKLFVLEKVDTFNLVILLILSIFIRILMLRAQIMVVTNFISRLSHELINNVVNSESLILSSEEQNEIRAILTLKMERLAFHGLIQGSTLLGAFSFLLLVMVFSFYSFGLGPLFYLTVIAFAYIFIFVITRKKRSAYSEEHNSSLDSINLYLNTLTNQLRELKSLKLEGQFASQFSKHNYLFRNTYGNLEFIGKFPKIVLESSVVLFLLALLTSNEFRSLGSADFLSLIPVAYLILRLVQAFQMGYVSINSILGNREVIESVCNAMVIYQDAAENEISNLPWPSNLEVKENGLTRFKFEGGKKYLLCGPSGSGKSTILELMLGYKSLENWSVTSEGIKCDADFDFSDVCYIYQGQRLLPVTLLENITGHEVSVDQERLREILRFLSIDHLLDRQIDPLKLPYTISGGEAQRIMIARALYGRYRAVIFDEATSALTANVDRKIHERFKENKNQFFLTVSHRPENIEDLFIKIEMDKI